MPLAQRLRVLAALACGGCCMAAWRLMAWRGSYLWLLRLVMRLAASRLCSVF